MPSPNKLLSLWHIQMSQASKTSKVSNNFSVVEIFFLVDNQCKPHDFEIHLKDNFDCIFSL